MYIQSRSVGRWVHGGYECHTSIYHLLTFAVGEAPVCHDVTVEPHLQQMTGEVISGCTSVVGDEARLDVSACGMGRKV